MSEMLGALGPGLGIAFLVVLIWGLIMYTERGFDRSRNAIENAISIPDGYVLDREPSWVDRMDNDWYRLSMEFKKQSYVCTEDEKINEPWKCECSAYGRQYARVWYNTKTKKMYQEASAFKVL